MTPTSDENPHPRFVNTQLSDEFVGRHKQIVVETVREKFEHVQEYLNTEYGTE